VTPPPTRGGTAEEAEAATRPLEPRLAPPGSVIGGPDEINWSRYRSVGQVVLVSLAAAAIALILAYGHYDLGQAPHRLWKAMLGAALASAVLTRPHWSLYMIPFVFAYLDWLPVSPIPMLNAVNLIVFSILIGWVGRDIVGHRRLLRPSPWNVPLALFLVWALFSWLYASLLGGSLGYAYALFQAFWNSMCGLLLFYMVYNNIGDMKHVRRLALTFCVGCAVGLVPLLMDSASYGGNRRVAGSIGQINMAGTFFATATLFALSLLTGGFRSLRARLLLLGSVAACTAGVVIPASRGAFVGFFAGMVPAVLRGGLVGLLLVGIVVGGAVLWAPDYVMDRVNDTQQAAVASDADRYEQLNEDSGGRLEFWKTSLGIIAGSPLFGVGFGRMHLAIGERIGQARSPHNFYLSTAGEMGIPGLLLLLYIFWVGYRRAGDLLRHRGFPRALALGYRAAVISLLVSNIFGGRFYGFNTAGMLMFLTALVFRAGALLEEPRLEPAITKEDPACISSRS